MPAPPEEGAQPAPAPSTAEQRYEIQQELGRGGMGVVYRALDTRLQRDVALKVLRATSAEETARLEREARVAATLNHPGIVTIYDFRPGFGGHFIVMEYVPGEPLDQLIRTDRERVRRSLVTILIRLADAVAFAHSRHVVHRDLKPGNILLTPSLDVKILDFGIAARLDIDAPKESQVCGTPFYMSPEQIRGEVPTPASDVYSLGATAFHLATGRPPFPRGDVINAHLEQPAPDPREQAPDLQPALARVILRCLAKEPQDRYPSAFALRDDLLPLESTGALVPGS
jgi:serine/threonine-protein kinase